MTVFQALTWESRDVDEEHLVSIFGRAEDGRSVCVTTPFKPYFFIKLDQYDNPAVIFKKLEDYVESYITLKSKDLWGFQNNEKRPFMKLNFKTILDMKLCHRFLQKTSHKIYEANIEPVLRLMHRTDIQSTGWLDTGDSLPTCPRVAKTDIDLFANDWRTLKPVARDDVAPFIVASFDIEANSSTGLFPNPDVPGDCVFQIGITLRNQGDPTIIDRTCLCYKKTDGYTSFDTERELLLAFRDYIVSKDIDIMTGWNIFGFDLEFLCKRAEMTGCQKQFYKLGKLVDDQSKLVYKELSSSALGDNMLKMLPMSGRFIFDLFHEVKREQKLDSYTLNFVSEKFLGDKKLDMSPKEMFKRFEAGDSKELSEVADYCVKDTLLPHFLMDKMCNILNLLEMAKATWVPICFLSERGQQIKVFSQIARTARANGFMVPTIRYGQIKPVPYEGATVLEAHTGAYYVPVTALDFEGLYPSIMMAHNLCYSTLVMNPKYDKIPGVTYESFTIDGRTHVFAQNVPSLLPLILAELKAFRKQAKRAMASATGQMKQVYNGKQLAYKVSMNSVYGFTGASKGILPCVPIAATVTFEGRHMIEQTKELVEREFKGAKVRYGDTDSVMVEFDMEGRTGQDALDYSWKLGEEASLKCNKLFKAPKNLELEKVYWPYILYSKKRYAAKMWTQGKDGVMRMDCVDVKGLQLVRRDTIPYTRDASKEVLNIMLESNDADRAVEVARERATQLLNGEVPMEKLLMSQKLAASYKSDNLPHVNVRDKMRERDPGSEPQPGDRVQFVLVETGNPKHKQFEKAEDPAWVQSHPKIKLDYIYYFTNKFVTPLSDLLDPLVKNPFAEIMKKTESTKKRRDLGCQDIGMLFKQYNRSKNK